jgi:hypothetical protein
MVQDKLHICSSDHPNKVVLAGNGLGIHESDSLSFDEFQTNRITRLKA